MIYNVYIRLAQLAAIAIVLLYGQLAYKYIFEGYGLHPLVCTAVMVFAPVLVHFGIVRNLRIMRDRV